MLILSDMIVTRVNADIDLLEQELAISINPLVFHLRDQDLLIEKANITLLGKI